MTVYMLILPNGKRYVGMTEHELKKRFNSGYGYSSNTNLDKDIKKYGWDNVRTIECASGLDIPEACNLEMQLIREYDTTNSEHGYNNSPGGDYFRRCRALIPEQEKMNEIILEAVEKLLALIQK